MRYLLKAVGADPEFFLKDGYGRPRPAIGLIGGTKTKPIPINNDGYSAIQEDNVMVEFNILPARSGKELAENIRLVLRHLTDKVTKQGLLVAIQPHMEFDPRQLNHPQAKNIGCDIDFNAWTLEPNPRLDAEQLGNIRTAGAHVHVSYDYLGKAPTDQSQAEVVRMLDIALGLPSVWLDDDNVRRKFYGKAGAFRPKDYGVEYRVLSNFWIKSPAMSEWVFNQIRWAFNRLNDALQVSPSDHPKIRQAIDTADRGLAQELMSKYDLRLPNFQE